MRVALFLTCVNDTLYPDTGRAVVKLLTRLGVEVDFPMAQTCCGQAHYNTGYRHEAEPLARHFSDVFGGYDAIVTPSGSCGAMVRELYPRMGERARAEGRGDALAATVAPVVPKTYELTEFLVDVLEVTDVGAYYPHHRTARPRRGDDRVVLPEDIGEMPGEWLGLVPVAGVVMRLPAAGLRHREVDLYAKPGQQFHHRATGVRIERVVDAGQEQGDTHRGSF